MAKEKKIFWPQPQLRVRVLCWSLFMPIIVFCQICSNLSISVVPKLFFLCPAAESGVQQRPGGRGAPSMRLGSSFLCGTASFAPTTLIWVVSQGWEPLVYIHYCLLSDLLRFSSLLFHSVWGIKKTRVDRDKFRLLWYSALGLLGWITKPELGACCLLSDSWIFISLLGEVVLKDKVVVLKSTVY